MMEDINNIPFSFDRNVSKWIAKLGVSHADNSFADGITLTNTVINNYSVDGEVVDKFTYKFTYKTKSGELKTVTRSISSTHNGFIGVLGIANRVLPDDNMFYTVEYSLERDPWKNFRNFEIIKVDEVDMTQFNDAMFKDTKVSDQPIVFPVYGLYFKASGNDENISYVYTYPRVANDYAVYSSANSNAKRVFIKLGKADPEVMMTELYYRNSAGHAYADYDANKTKYLVDNDKEGTTGLDPN
jgi:hypothetical protein